jgi:hypothetical protein
VLCGFVCLGEHHFIGLDVIFTDQAENETGSIAFVRMPADGSIIDEIAC